MNMDYERLKPVGQICFPLYAASKEVIRKYKPYLEKMDLTCTQYFVMLVLWERKSLTVKELGTALYLDSGTLTPVLKKLESKGYVTRRRSCDDERIVIIGLTEKGVSLEEEASRFPKQLVNESPLDIYESIRLNELLYKLLNGMIDE